MSSIEWQSSSEISELPPTNDVDLQNYLIHQATAEQRNSFMSFHAEHCVYTPTLKTKTELGQRALDYPLQLVAGNIGTSVFTVRQNNKHMVDNDAYMVTQYDASTIITKQLHVTNIARRTPSYPYEWSLMLDNGGIINLHQNASPDEKPAPRLNYTPELYLQDITLLPSRVAYLLSKATTRL